MGNDGDRLAIPLSELDGFGGRLRSIKNRMNRTKATFESYRDDIGDGGVVDKLEDFESGWKDGRGDIDDQLSSLAEMSDTVVREAHKVDVDLENELKKGTKKEETQVGGGNQ
ncbi:hypothetical protein [Streptomyces sp. CMB-StM0423]|uniref:hypothetical protein n=1 Tax=Streptomyces sp. CMB-StM0423 TaxID=2059884 RepID=UPI000C700AA9|nr:hypothetical protein [Streptomyces sp. CMB-StM0423]AUH42430.1 hypothetical protein CXR04_21555 [Streptomyces sp. CMB-StM0423]